MTRPTVAVLTLAHGRHDHLRGQIAGLAQGDRLPDLHVVAAMDDAQVAQVAIDAWAEAGRSRGASGPPRPTGRDGSGGETPGRPTGQQVRVLAVPVPRHPLGLPLADARNLAAAAATGEGADHLIFLDVDCIPGPGTVSTYADALAELPRADAPSPAVLCGDVAYLPPLPPGQDGWADPADLDRLPDVAEHRPDRVRLALRERRAESDLNRFWSLSFALTAPDFWAAGAFCPDFVGYGGEDTDFAQAVGARGGSLTWVGGATAYHQHHESTSPPVGHLEAIVRNAGVFEQRWGWWPMEGWLEAFAERGLAAPDREGRWQVTR